MSENKNLWEVEHRYYCNEGNYYASGHDRCHSEFKRWQDFHDEFGDSDMDYNLVFRWDWQEKYSDEMPTYNGDDYYRNGKLLIFFMGQRKGLYFWSEVDVCRADEPAVIEWLKPRMKHLMSLWEPLSEGVS